jgi:hypothetical protein
LSYGRGRRGKTIDEVEVIGGDRKKERVSLVAGSTT